eukprot:gene16026-22164_t
MIPPTNGVLAGDNLLDMNVVLDCTSLVPRGRERQKILAAKYLALNLEHKVREREGLKNVADMWGNSKLKAQMVRVQADLRVAQPFPTKEDEFFGGMAEKTWEKVEGFISLFLGFVLKAYPVRESHHYSLELFCNGDLLFMWFLHQLTKGKQFNSMYDCLHATYRILRWLLGKVAEEEGGANLSTFATLQVNLSMIKFWASCYSAKKGDHPFKVEDVLAELPHDPLPVPLVQSTEDLINHKLAKWKDNVSIKGGPLFMWLTQGMDESYRKPNFGGTPAIPQAWRNKEPNNLPHQIMAKVVQLTVDACAKAALVGLYKGGLDFTVATNLREAAILVLLWGYKGLTRVDALRETVMAQDPPADPSKATKNIVWLDNKVVHLTFPNTNRTNVKSLGMKKVAQDQVHPHDIIPLGSLGGALLEAWIEIGRPFFKPKTNHLLLDSKGHKFDHTTRVTEEWSAATLPFRKQLA